MHRSCFDGSSGVAREPPPAGTSRLQKYTSGRDMATGLQFGITCSDERPRRAPQGEIPGPMRFPQAVRVLVQYRSRLFPRPYRPPCPAGPCTQKPKPPPRPQARQSRASRGASSHPTMPRFPVGPRQARSRCQLYLAVTSVMRRSALRCSVFRLPERPGPESRQGYRNFRDAA